MPVYRRLLGDTLTPVSAFHKIDAGRSACLFESVIGGEKVGRYSFLAADPFLQIEARGQRGHGHVGQRRASEFDCGRSARRAAHARVEAIRAATLPELPPFTSGAVGYAGYDVVRYSEHLPNAPPNDRELPDLAFAFYDQMVVFDNVNKTIVVVAMARLDKFGARSDGGLRTTPSGASTSWSTQLRTAATASCAPADIDTRGDADDRLPVELHASDDFEAAVREVRRVHPGRRHLSGRHQPAAGSSTIHCAAVRDLSHAAGGEPQPVHVLPAHAAA